MWSVSQKGVVLYGTSTSRFLPTPVCLRYRRVLVTVMGEHNDDSMFSLSCRGQVGGTVTIVVFREVEGCLFENNCDCEA